MSPEPKKEKPIKLEAKPQPRASSRKPSHSPSKRDRSRGASACEGQEEEQEASSPDKCQPSSLCSHDHKVFQRTLSPADVLHVHSYAKGDYGEGDVHIKEEKNEASETRAERDKRQSKPVSALPARVLQAPPHHPTRELVGL